MFHQDLSSLGAASKDLVSVVGEEAGGCKVVVKLPGSGSYKLQILEKSPAGCLLLTRQVLLKEK